MKSSGKYKEGPNAGGDGLTTGARRRILKACSDGRNSIEDDQHPAHIEFHSIAKEVGGEWSGDSTNVRSLDASSPLPSFERPNARDIRQTSFASEGSHYSPVAGTGKSASGNMFQKAAKSTTSELIARVEALAVKAAGAKDHPLANQLVELGQLLKNRSANFNGGRRLSGGRRTFAERHAG